VQIIVVLTSLFLVRMSAHMVLRDGHRRKLFDDECLPGQWEAPAESDLQNAGPIFSDAFLRGPFAARGESGAGRPTPERSLGRAARCPRWLSFGGGRSRGCGSQAERPNAPPTAISRSDPAVGRPSAHRLGNGRAQASPAICQMSDLYSTVPQREIQAAVGAVISLAKYRDLLLDDPRHVHRGVKVVGKPPRAKYDHPKMHSKWPYLLWALQGLNLRLPPCEGGTLPLS
jgi:hypothetical protein